jgi:glycosyltransferase involved in cell wall biosynthesis
VDELRVAMTLEQCWHRVPGGTAVAAIELARELATRAGVDLVGVAARHRGPPPPPWTPPVEVRTLPLPRLLLYEAWHVLGRPAVERATGPVDVIHATGVAVPPRTAPIVVTVHDLAFLRYPEYFSRAGLRFFRQAFRRLRERADLVLCSSLATLEHCAAAGVDRERLRHAPLGVRAVPAGAADVERVRGRYGLPRPYVLWAGTLEPRKNLPRLLEAFATLPHDVDLALVGPPGWKEQVRSQPRVRTLGFVPGDDLRALYAGAEVFCFPSLMEGFGFPVLEAMAQGTPVVTSTGTSTEELAGDSGVLVDPEDADEIAAGIARLLDDRALAATLADRGRERVRRYTWARTADLALAAYEELRLR